MSLSPMPSSQEAVPRVNSNGASTLLEVYLHA
uniref:Rbr3 n=1 Tax=Arundo donax TaxID=35708 RepID=A0A0A9F3W2_ARUDO